MTLVEIMHFSYLQATGNFLIQTRDNDQHVNVVIS